MIARTAQCGLSLLWGEMEVRCIRGTTPGTMRTEKPVGRGAGAGGLWVGTMVGFAAAGYGLGSLVGAAVAFGIAGLFAGLVAGFALVYARFRDL
jgi:hypothetical protein